MNKKNLFIIVLLIALFFFGFFSGILVRKTTYDEVRTEFQSQVVDLQQDLQQAEYVNRKLKMVFQTVEEKNEQIREKNQVIQEKESEIQQLSEKIARSADPAKIQRLVTQLNQKNEELKTLRIEYNKLQAEVMQANEELAQAQKVIQEKNDKIASLSKEIQTGGTPKAKELKEEIGEVRDQITHYEQGAKFELTGDSFRGFGVRKRKDQAYHSAYYHYQLAGASFDMDRVYNKIVSAEIREKIDQGGDLSDDSDLFDDFDNTRIEPPGYSEESEVIDEEL